MPRQILAYLLARTEVLKNILEFVALLTVSNLREMHRIAHTHGSRGFEELYPERKINERVRLTAAIWSRYDYVNLKVDSREKAKLHLPRIYPPEREERSSKEPDNLHHLARDEGV